MYTKAAIIFEMSTKDIFINPLHQNKYQSHLLDSLYSGAL